MPASSLDGGPNFSGSRLDVAIANIAQFGNAPTFPTGATFPSGAGAVFFGGGDDVSYYVAGTAFEMDARQGTAASPITVGSGPTFKISRTESITAASMPAGIGANNQGNAALWASATGDANNQAQVSAILATAITLSTQVKSTQVDPDACGIQGQASVMGSGVGTALGGYVHGRRDTDTGKAYGLEARVSNFTGTAGTYNPTGASNTAGISITAGGNVGAINGVGISIGIGNGTSQFDTGIGFTTLSGISSIVTAAIRDDSTSATSLLINNAHATAAIAVAAGAGGVWIGATAQGQTPSLLEVIGPNSSNDPLVVIGAIGNSNTHTIRVRNASGQNQIAVCATGAIYAGNAAGDMVIGPVTSGKVLHLGGSATCLDITRANVMTSQVDHIFAAHIVSTASGAPTTTNLGANVTSVTFTGNDVRGTIAVVMSGALAANTRISTNTFAVSYGATSPKVTLVDQTSAVGLTIVNFYVSAQSTGVSFDLACDQALGAGTFTIDYIVLG